MYVNILPAERAAHLKAAYTVRHVDLNQQYTLIEDAIPARGDLVVARVSALGHHTWVELPSGRRATLYVGDELLLACGARYAPDQFEAELPEDLGPADLVAAGGVLGKVHSKHAQMGNPTRLDPVGLLGDAEGRVLNLRDFRLPEPPTALRPPTTIVVVGTSMNSGKTTTVAAIVRGLTLAGLRVGTAKLTGTGAGGDPWLFRDAGAVAAYDFTDAGYPTTFRVPLDDLVESSQLLHGHLAAQAVDAVVLEIADGVLQAETAALLDRPEMRRIIDGMVFASGEAAGALYGVQRLQSLGLPVLAVSGLLTCSPLAMREAAAGLSVPVYTPADLCSPMLASSLLDRVSGTMPEAAGDSSMLA